MSSLTVFVSRNVSSLEMAGRPLELIRGKSRSGNDFGMALAAGHSPTFREACPVLPSEADIGAVFRNVSFVSQ
jgi:hypothetical protein